MSSGIVLRIVKSAYDQLFIIIFKHGKLDTPLFIFEDYEFQELIEQYNREKEEFK